jgi:hypothetical protein
MMKKTKRLFDEAKGEEPPSQLIDAQIKELDHWREETLALARSLIRRACLDVVEER